ncbi:MAG: hypothetical protein HQ515_02655 [Phycisphaeraceae bacterium]|nr:hypothetical protein [Phycisphaeraceae bacterium]
MQVSDRKQEEERFWFESLEQGCSHAPAFVARYKFAQKHVSNKRVYDIASGAGYGSFLLSQSASQLKRSAQL